MGLRVVQVLSSSECNPPQANKRRDRGKDPCALPSHPFAPLRDSAKYKGGETVAYGRSIPESGTFL